MIENMKLIPLYSRVMCLLVLLGLLAACKQEPIALPRTETETPLITSSVVQSNAPTEPITLKAKIDDYMEREKFNGSIMIADHGQILYEAGYGMANEKRNELNTPSTIFRIGSMTKQFTAMAIMQLVEQGQINVQNTLQQYLPAFKQNSKLTIHHLLTHTSGMARDYPYSEAGNSLEDVVHKYLNKPLEFKPGDHFQYSNVGYVLLSYIIEKVSGQTYETYLKEHIFKPIGMKNTGFDPYHFAKLNNRASGYRHEGSLLRDIGNTDVEFNYGDGALYSTAEDLLLWERALYSNKLVDKTSMEQIWTPYTTVNGNESYGYGWFISHDSDKHIYHGGLVAGFSSYILLNSLKEKVVIILSNVQMDEKIEGIAMILERLSSKT